MAPLVRCDLRIDTLWCPRLACVLRNTWKFNQPS
jgi:hypothetical protein